MNQWAPVSRRVSVAFSIILAISLVTGLIPVSAFADTAVKVSTVAPAQVSETVNIAAAQPTQAGGEGQAEGLITDEQAPQSPAPAKTSNQAASGQTVAAVALGADTTTVLDNGLIFVIDNATNTAAVTGWYGTQPAQNLAVPAEIRHNGKLSVVNILGGGGGSLQP